MTNFLTSPLPPIIAKINNRSENDDDNNDEFMMNLS